MLWDYELNDFKPSEIPAGSKKRAYFKCEKGIHESFSRRISHLTEKPDHRLICKDCVYHADDQNQLFRLRRSRLYRNFRNEVIQKDGGKCIICGATNHLEVHHIYPFATCPNHRTDVSTAITLCKKHHTVTNECFHSMYGKSDNTPE